MLKSSPPHYRHSWAIPVIPCPKVYLGPTTFSGLELGLDCAEVMLGDRSGIAETSSRAITKVVDNSLFKG